MPKTKHTMLSAQALSVLDGKVSDRSRPLISQISAVGFGIRPSPEGWCLTADDDGSHGVKELQVRVCDVREDGVYRVF